MKTLPVYYEGRLAATLEQDSAGGYALEYDEAWVRDGFDISVNLPRTQLRHSGDAVRAFFENVLPERTVRAALAGVLGVSENNIFGMLARIGRDCAGAFSVGEPQREGEYRALSPAKMSDVLKSLSTNPMATRQRGTSLSLAGAQDKLPLLFSGSSFYLPLYGAASNCIVKLPIPNFPHSVGNEFFCMRLAHLSGLSAAPVSIHHLPDMDVLVVQRYDRTGEGFHPQRLAQEDFCQLSGMSSELKYEAEGGPSFADCAALIAAHSMQRGRDMLRLVQWAAFNLCIGNNDAHAKNISMLRNGAKLVLAPFYDLISTTFYGRRLQQRLAMKIGGKAKSFFIARSRWESFAHDIMLPPNAVFQTVESTARAILASLDQTARVGIDAGVPADVVSKLRTHVEARTVKVLEQLSEK